MEWPRRGGMPSNLAEREFVTVGWNPLLAKCQENRRRLAALIGQSRQVAEQVRANILRCRRERSRLGRVGLGDPQRLRLHVTPTTAPCTPPLRRVR